jgi:hypothetical protein
MEEMLGSGLDGTGERVTGQAEVYYTDEAEGRSLPIEYVIVVSPSFHSDPE